MWIAYAICSALFKQNLRVAHCRAFVFGLLIDCSNSPVCSCVSITASKARFVNVARGLICARSYHFVVAVWRAKEAQSVG